MLRNDISSQMTNRLLSFVSDFVGSSKWINSLVDSAIPTIIFFISIPFVFFIFCACLPICFNFFLKRKPSLENIDMESGESNTGREISIQTVPDDPPAYEDDLSPPPGYEEAKRLPQIPQFTSHVVT